jgi:hypothetical protein
MTDYLYRLQDKVSYLRDGGIIDLTTIVLQEKDIEFDICQLNISQLFDFGINSNNIVLAPYRSSIYAEMKFNLSGHDYTDLRLSGDFQRNFYLIFSGQTYGIYSSDEKTSELVLKYGEDIFGLTEQNKEQAFYILKPRLSEITNDYLRKL